MGSPFALSLIVLAVALIGATPARAYTHPCIPTTLDELKTIKASLGQEPWKSGYSALAGDGRAKLTYRMQGPFEEIKRNPNVNLWPWRNDMTAVYHLARMWYFTGDGDYAEKARDILIVWATTHKSFGGNESGLDLGDYAACYAGGASILRGTWPGWTEADTATVKNYFQNVLWPASLVGSHVPGPANKGSLYMAAGIAIAVFCDDRAKFDYLINLFRSSHSAGLPNTLATGEMGETGRDLGHGQGDLLSKVFFAEVAWKQGVDLFSEMDNRLLACGEYYARNTLCPDNPFVPFGTIDYHYWVNADGHYTANRAMFHLLQNAYHNRLRLPTPWIDRKLMEQPVDGSNFMFARVSDATTAKPPPPMVFPDVSPASDGLTLTGIGNRTEGRGMAHANGVWTVTGRGDEVWRDAGQADDCQFACREMTGDCAIVARVTSCLNTGNAAKAGLMIRDNLTAPVSQRAWIAIKPGDPCHFEAHMTGWTSNWGGRNWARRSQPLPPGMPYWLKIERRAGMITTFASRDGTSWAAVTNSHYADLPSKLHLGLFVTSGSASANTATFDNVAFTGGRGGIAKTPPAPAAVFASGFTGGVTVRWLPSFGAESYDLLRSATPGGGHVVIASDLGSDKTSYVDANVVENRTYHYSVRANNAAGTSGNSPGFAAARLPKLVRFSNAGTSDASINGGTGVEGSAKAFDANPGSKWFCHDAPTGWIQHDLGEGRNRILRRYTINSADVPERDPENWKLFGSNDGASWTTLDSRNDQSFAYRMQLKSYDIANATAFRFHRLEITANHGAPALAVAEIGLWCDAESAIPDETRGQQGNHHPRVNSPRH